VEREKLLKQQLNSVRAIPSSSSFLLSLFSFSLLSFSAPKLNCQLWNRRKSLTHTKGETFFRLSFVCWMFGFMWLAQIRFPPFLPFRHVVNFIPLTVCVCRLTFHLASESETFSSLFWPHRVFSRNLSFSYLKSLEMPWWVVEWNVFQEKKLVLGLKLDYNGKIELDEFKFHEK
jgi:hypothetical protein